jgi:GMP synthase-like glutamine amidotransferase
MRPLHIIRNARFEGPGAIAEWAWRREVPLTESLAVTEEFPDPRGIAGCIVMGGPMAADDTANNPWLLAEQRFLSAVVDDGAPVLGICLGSQILAALIGGTVLRNRVPEIGWYSLTLTDAGRSEPLFTGWPDDLVVGHWHGDTFDLPPGIEPCLTSEACANQAFVAEGGRVVGLQFHAEWTAQSLAELVDECRDDLAGGGEWVASEDELLLGTQRYLPWARPPLFDLLDRLFGTGE